MRKSLSFIVFVMVVFSVDAQRFEGGIFAGLTTTQVSGDQLAGFNKTGFVAGGIVSTSLGKNFDVAMEIMYIQKGSRKKARPDDNDYTSYLMKLNYAEIPLLVSYTYLKRIKIEAGPSFGKLLSSYEEDEQGELPARMPFKEFEFSINGGLSYRIYKGLYIHSRLATSVIPIRPHASGQTYYFNRGQYNTVLFFSLKYMISLKKKDVANP